MTVMKMKAPGFPRLEQLDLAAQLPIVISRDHNRFAEILDSLQQLASFAGRGLIVHQIAEDNQTARPILIDQLQQTLRDRLHPPHRNKPAGSALAQFVAKMEVRHGEPALALVEERQPAIEQNFVGDERLVRA